MKTKILSILAILITITTYSQQTLSGTVTNEWGEFLNDAHIIIVGKQTGVVAIDGRYQITAQPKDTLRVSHLGYETKEVLVSDKKNIDFIVSLATLDEVLISVQAESRVTCGFSYCYTTCVTNCSVELTEETLGNAIPEKTSTITLYPNPSPSGYFKLKFPEKHKDLSVEVFSITGQKIRSFLFNELSTTVSLDLSSLAKGIYLVKAAAGNKELGTQKALVQ